MAHWQQAKLEPLIKELSSMRAAMLQLAGEGHDQVEQLHETYRRSGVNLLHYLALRRHDLRPLQERLAALGLSSLGRAEAHVLTTIDAVLRVLDHLAGRAANEVPAVRPPVSIADGHQLLRTHTEALLGPRPARHGVRVMVTMPSEAADDFLLVRDLLASGMDGMRINCAHDSADEWGRMIENLRRAERQVGKKCRVFMDLGGPKLRTGPVEPGPQVLKCRPERDAYGRIVAPARVWLAPPGVPAPAPADAVLPLREEWLAELTAGDRINVMDTRGSDRRLTVVAAFGDGRWAECERTTYFATGMELTLRGAKDGPRRKSRIGELPAKPGAISLHSGDTLLLTRDFAPGKATVYDAQGALLTPATIACTLPEVFDDVRVGERVFLDDGKIGGVIQAAARDHLRIAITQAGPDGETLRADKGINLPDSELRLPALTAKDLEDLDFVARNADAVSLSFVHTPADVLALHEELAKRNAGHLGVVLKIETRQAFQQLPSLLLAAMRGSCVGVMIARGDLAIECGFERMAEVQEEMLWVCEAAHVPVVWATQVLESLAKTGRPSRAEVTDAAMSERAECVMLNKGPHVVTAVRVLNDILARMFGHQQKKVPLLRSLGLANAFCLSESGSSPGVNSQADSKPAPLSRDTEPR